MNLVADLSNAISVVESVIAKLKNKEEICISDIESSLYEWRGALFAKTQGNHPLFYAGDKRYKFSLRGQNMVETEFAFLWPSEAMEPIRSVVVSKGIVYVTSADTGEILPVPVDDEHTEHFYIIPDIHQTFRVGKINLPDHCIQASKTNLIEVV